METNKKMTQSEIDGVEYRQAKNGSLFFCREGLGYLSYLLFPGVRKVK